MLMQYLYDNFITLERLLALTKLDKKQLNELQRGAIVPLPAYTIDVTLTSKSFFGGHDELNQIEFYPKGTIDWINSISRLSRPQELAFRLFATRFNKRLMKLVANGHHTRAPAFNAKLEEHIEQEWVHFIAGSYGVCTKTGIPEEIVAKELATAEIKELIELTRLSSMQIEKLQRAVNLLDSVSAEFAPHERHRSSRHQYIDLVREKYGLAQMKKRLHKLAQMEQQMPQICL